MPGGGVEEGEGLKTALKREMMEETSLEMVDCKYLEKVRINQVTQYFYKCNLTEGKAVMGGPEAEDQNKDNCYILE